MRKNVRFVLMLKEWIRKGGRLEKKGGRDRTKSGRSSSNLENRQP